MAKKNRQWNIYINLALKFCRKVFSIKFNLATLKEQHMKAIIAYS